LHWVDIHAGHLHTFNPRSGEDEKQELGISLGCAAPRQKGGFLLGLRDGIAALAPDSVSAQYLAQPEPHLPGNRFNDGKCDPAGRFLAGTMDNAEKEATGSLYSYSPTGEIKTLLTGIRISNGITWSPDYKTLYYIDTPTFEIAAFDYDLQTGEIANRRVAVSIPPALGFPDGMTADKQGRLWVGMWGGAAITIWQPQTGQLLEKIELPAKNVTACAFGGENGSDLYITSARIGLGAEDLTAYPASGLLFRVQTDVEGLPTFPFAG
jgi:sugar lactone lactonase YvrE